MSIADWFSQRERRRYAKAGTAQTPVAASELPDGVWVRCRGCKRTLYERELAAALRVCEHCGYHFPMTAAERIASLVDEGSFVEHDASLSSCDPLGFTAAKAYAATIAAAREATGLADAIVTGRASIAGAPAALGVMDFRFIGASMGSVVGEKVARLFEKATSDEVPVVIVVASGGARMQEGMLSLMQMAKTAAARQRHHDAGLAHISVLTDPTYGGVTASFAVLADVILAEPGAMIGFAGPRLVEQTIRQKLPKGFQTAEAMLAHGMIDEVVPRRHLRGRLALLLSYLDKRRHAEGASR